MKLIVGISAIAVLGAALIYNVQNNETAESEKIAKVNEATPVVNIAEQDQVESLDSADPVEVVDAQETIIEPIAIEAIKITPKKKMAIKIAPKKAIIAPVVTKKALPVEDKIVIKQAAINKTEIKLPTNKSEKPKKAFSAAISILGTTDFKETSDSSKHYSGRTSMSLGYQINDAYKVSLASSISKDLSTSYEENVGDTSLSLKGSAIDLGAGTKLIPSIKGTYPTSKRSKVLNEMNGAVSLVPVFVNQLTSSLSASYVQSLTAYSHKYKTNRVNATNKKYTFLQSAGLDYSLTDSLSLGTGLSFIKTWSYSGRSKDDQFSTEIGLSYAFKNKTSISSGISTGGLLYEAEKGPDSNIEFYDSKTTSFYIVYGIAL
jgi:hypothetical protein